MWTFRVLLMPVCRRARSPAPLTAVGHKKKRRQAGGKASAARAFGCEAACDAFELLREAQRGIPMGRRDRPLAAWYGDMDFMPPTRMCSNLQKKRQ
jgi:hypothetical protein